MMKRGWFMFPVAAMLVAGMVGTSYADVKLSGELRLRGVMVDNDDATTTPKDGGYFEQRTRLKGEASVDERAKVVLQIQDSRKWGEEANTATTGNDDQAIDLSQAYVEIGNLFDQPLSVKFGRQAMAYGEHRLIGSFEWSNNARRFDAIKLMYKHDIVDIDAWTAKISEANEDWGNEDSFNGIYAMLKNVPKNAVDLYLLQKVANFGDTNFYTLGGRVKGAVEQFNVDYTAEVAVQTGDATKTADQDASAYAIRAGYTVPDILGGLRVGVEYDAATGEDTGTTDKEAFDNLYPTNHYLYGFTDDVGWSNTRAWSVNVSLKPIDKVKAAVEYWDYTLDEKDSGGKDDNGTEINVKLNHELSKNINCEAAYVIRNAGDASTAKAYDSATFGSIPADKSATFGYFMINVNFM